MSDAKQSIEEIFYDLDPATEGVSIKYSNYLSVYDTVLANYRDRKLKLLEIGVLGGGSLSLWSRYFSDISIVGIDIDATCKQYERDNIIVEIGDQTDTDFLTELNAKHGPFDIIIDDASHFSKHQKITFNTMFPLLSAQGLYIIEDLHTSYWPQFGGDFCRDVGVIDFIKPLLDAPNLWAIGMHGGQPPSDAAHIDIHSVQMYTGVCVIQKSRPGSTKITSRKRGT
jgi:hypothetical protein